MNGELYMMLRKAKPLRKVCEDEAWVYYEVVVCSYILMYRTNRYRPDGRRFYKLGDQLAKALGWWSVDGLIWHSRKERVRWHKRWFSAQELNNIF